MRVHIIFYSLGSDVNILPVDLQWKHHLGEYLNNVVSLDDSLLRCLIDVAVMFKQCVKDRLLYLRKLNIIRICLFVREG